MRDARLSPRVPAATCTRDRRHAAAGGTPASSTRTRRRSPTCRSTARSATYNTRLRRQHPHLRRDAGQEHRRRQRRRRALVPAEHAAAERPGAGAAAPLVRPARRARSRPTTVPTNGTPGALGDTFHGLLNGVNIFPRRRCSTPRRSPGELTWMQWVEGHAERGGVQGPRAATPAIDKPSQNFFGLAVNFTPTWFQVCRAWTCSRRSRGARASPATPRCSSAATRTPATGAPASPPTSTRSTRSISSTSATSATTRPTRATRRERPCPTATIASLSDRGWVVAHVQDHVLKEERIMFRKTHCSPLASRRSQHRARFAAVSADEAKQLGTTLTAVGAEKAGNKDGTIPEYTGGIEGRRPSSRRAAASARSRSRARSRASSIDGKNAAQHADKLTEGTKELLKRYPDDARRRLSDASHGRGAREGRSTTPRRTPSAPRPSNGGLGSRTCCPAIRSRFRRPAPRRCGTTCCATRGVALRQLKYETWNVDAAGVPTLATAGRLVNEWPIYDPKHADGADQGQRRRTGRCKLALHRAGAPQRRSADARRLGQSDEAAAPRVAVPAGPAPREARAGPRLRHAEPRHGRRVDVLRRRSVFNGAMDRFDWKLVGKKEMYVPYSGYKLTYARTSSRRSPSRTTSIRTSCAGSCIACGWSRRRSSRASATSTASACSTSTRTAGPRSRPTSTTRAASSIAPSFAQHVVQLRRAGAVIADNVRDLRLQLGRRTTSSRLFGAYGRHAGT